MMEEDEQGMDMERLWQQLKAEDRQRIRETLGEADENIRTKGIYTVEGRQLLTGYDYGQFYDWDLYFENIYALYHGETRFCFSNLEAFFALRQPDGFIPRSFGPYPYGQRHPFKPFIAQLVLMGCNTLGDYTFARVHFDEMLSYLRCYETRYDGDGNGLCSWVNADASGMDNQNSRVLPNGHGEGVDLNCYLYREYTALSALAEACGRKEDAPRLAEKARRIGRAVNAFLWDEGVGFYFDRDDEEDELVPVKGVSGFMPLWAGIATPAQAEKLVGHLRNPAEFAAPYPIPSLSMDDRLFDPTGEQAPSPVCNWNGPTWIPTNYMVFHGLLRYGYREDALSLAEKTLALATEKNHTLREYYNSLTGEGYGRNPFYGWSALACVMTAEALGEIDPTALPGAPVPPLLKGLGL